MTKAGDRILNSTKQALAFAEDQDGHGCVAHIPEEINVRRIRNKLGMSQKAFAEYFGVNLRTVQDWEQGRRAPSGPSRNFLFVIDKEPDAVRRVLMQDHPEMS